MLIKKITEELFEERVTKTFVLELKNGRKVTIQKWLVDGNYPEMQMAEVDYEILDGEDPEAFDDLTEEQQDELTDYINEIEIRVTTKTKKEKKKKKKKLYIFWFYNQKETEDKDIEWFWSAGNGEKEAWDEFLKYQREIEEQDTKDWSYDEIYCVNDAVNKNQL